MLEVPAPDDPTLPVGPGPDSVFSSFDAFSCRIKSAHCGSPNKHQRHFESTTSFASSNGTSSIPVIMNVPPTLMTGALPLAFLLRPVFF